jgi:hypothetical protein
MKPPVSRERGREAAAGGPIVARKRGADKRDPISSLVAALLRA